MLHELVDQSLKRLETMQPETGPSAGVKYAQAAILIGTFLGLLRQHYHRDPDLVRDLLDRRR